LHPVFHSSLLEPYSDPSEFHPHVDPLPFEIADASLNIQSIIDSRKTGQRYEYLIHWKDQPSSEDSWVSLSDIPDSFDELIDRFHRRHPRSSRPPNFILELRRSVPSHSISQNSDSTSVQYPVPSPVVRRPHSPPTIHQNLRSDYVPPAQTTTRSGRISKPARRLDPIV
ncbi:hypothetical protein F5050DRAFT_1582375, partial [Lentinula boryana]